MNPSDIKNMSVISRLQTMEAIWDSLLHEETEIESPEWHHNILRERKTTMTEGKAKFISINELKANFKE